MRRPIQRQLLAPMLAAVALAVLASSLLSAALVAGWTRERERQRLSRVVDTLTQANFPLTEAVLKKMGGLSGAEFVSLDARGQTRATTTRLSPDELAALGRLPPRSQPQDLAAGQRLTLAGKIYLADRLPIVGSRGKPEISSLVVLYPVELQTAAWREAAPPLLGVGLLAALCVSLWTTVQARRLVVPIQALGRQAACISGGDFTPLPVPARDDEIRDLIVSINSMIDRLKRYEGQVRQNERLRTLGQLGGGIAHQLRNSATGGRMALDLHRRECPLEPDCETLQVALAQFTLMESYLQRFLTLGRPWKPSRNPVELGELVDDVLRLLRPALTHARVDLRWIRPPQGVWLDADAESLRQLLLNLLTNALQAVGAEKGQIGVEIFAQGDRVILQIHDSGPGPAKSVRESLFEPFVTDRPDGTGLGLAVAREIAQEHAATIDWQRRDGQTLFAVTFPKLVKEIDRVAPAGCG